MNLDRGRANFGTQARVGPRVRALCFDFHSLPRARHLCAPGFVFGRRVTSAHVRVCVFCVCMYMCHVTAAGQHARVT